MSDNLSQPEKKEVEPQPTSEKKEQPLQKEEEKEEGKSSTPEKKEPKSPHQEVAEEEKKSSNKKEVPPAEKKSSEKKSLKEEEKAGESGERRKNLWDEVESESDEEEKEFGVPSSEPLPMASKANFPPPVLHEIIIENDPNQEEEEEELEVEEGQEEYDTEGFEHTYGDAYEDFDDDPSYNFVTVTIYSSMRKQISYCISKLRDHQPITLAGMEHAVGKVITMVEILKERIGWLYQVTNFTTQLYEVDKGNKVAIHRRVGIIVKLCKETLDEENVGFQKPKPPQNLAPQSKNHGDSKHPQNGSRSRSQGRFRRGERFRRDEAYDSRDDSRVRDMALAELRYQKEFKKNEFRPLRNAYIQGGPRASGRPNGGRPIVKRGLEGRPQPMRKHHDHYQERFPPRLRYPGRPRNQQRDLPDDDF